MAFIQEFGAYLPDRVVSNREAGAMAGCDEEWIRDVSGIEERRFAAEGESVADLALQAAADCLSRASAAASTLGMILVACGSAERQFPGPAASVARGLGLDGVPAIDVPMASAGSLFAMSLAARLTGSLGGILVIGAEKMSSVAMRKPMERGVAILFGDGAGACLISPDRGLARIVDSALYTDGNYADDLMLDFNQPLVMNGRSVIMQASRKIPRAIGDLLAKHGVTPSEVEVFLMHQANQNLIDRVARVKGFVGHDSLLTKRNQVSDGNVAVSSRTGQGLAELATAVGAILSTTAPEGEIRELSERHRGALGAARAWTTEALGLLDSGATLDLAAAALRSATDELDQIQGRTTPEDLLSAIFERFCLGK